jgi:hypothetical protein
MGRLEALQETVAEIEAQTHYAESLAEGAQWELQDILKAIMGF